MNSLERHHIQIELLSIYSNRYRALDKSNGGLFLKLDQSTKKQNLIESHIDIAVDKEILIIQNSPFQ